VRSVRNFHSESTVLKGVHTQSLKRIVQESGEKKTRLMLGKTVDKMCDISVNFGAIWLKFEWKIAVNALHRCLEFRSD